MKTLKYIFLVIPIIVIIFSCKSQIDPGKKYHEIVLQSQGVASKVQLEESEKIISGRLKSLQINDFEITQNNEKCQLIIKTGDSLNTPDLSNVLLVKGTLNFYLTYGKQEVQTFLKKLDPATIIANEKSISALLALLENNNSSPDMNPIIGSSDLKDTAIISRCLNSMVIRNQLPGDLKFMWSRNKDHQGKYGLYAISLNNNISGTLIIDASKAGTTPPEKSINLSKDASKLKRTSTENGISLTFNNDGSAQWKDLTRKNLGRSVAMVIDDKVYSAPTVRSEIDNGSCMITGNFTEQEIKNLVAILNNRDLPIEFQLMD